MRLSVVDLAVVICFGFAIAAVYGFRMTPRFKGQSTGCGPPLISRGYPYRVSGAPVGYCLVFGAKELQAPIISPLSPPRFASPRPRIYAARCPSVHLHRSGARI
jgi:hypothetical protein